MTFFTRHIPMMLTLAYRLVHALRLQNLPRNLECLSSYLHRTWQENRQPPFFLLGIALSCFNATGGASTLQLVIWEPHHVFFDPGRRAYFRGSIIVSACMLSIRPGETRVITRIGNASQPLSGCQTPCLVVYAAGGFEGWLMTYPCATYELYPEYL